MKNNILLIVFICLNFSLISCQEKETYWVVDGLTKENGEPMTGITLAYMEALAGRQFQIYKNGDVLEFMFPVAKKIKTEELKSLTDIRLKETGQLVDSVYAVKVSGDKLGIKISYIGTAQDDKRFSLNFIKVDKEKFYNSLKKLQADHKQIMDKVKKVEVSKLDLSIPMPAYFNKADLTALSPMQGIDLFLGAESDDIQPTVQSFTLEKEGDAKNKDEFSIFGVNIPAKHNYAAKFAGVDFNGLEFVNSGTNKPLAIKLTRDSLDKKNIQQLFESINKSQPADYVVYSGLPVLFEGEVLPIAYSISATWSDKENIVKLIIDDIPEKLYNQETDIKVYVPENGNQSERKKVFLHYLNLLEKSKIHVVIMDKDFENRLLNDSGSQSDMKDYFK